MIKWICKAFNLRMHRSKKECYTFQNLSRPIVCIRGHLMDDGNKAGYYSFRGFVLVGFREPLAGF